MHSFDRKILFENIVKKGNIELFLITQILYLMYTESDIDIKKK